MNVKTIADQLCERPAVPGFAFCGPSGRALALVRLLRPHQTARHGARRLYRARWTEQRTRPARSAGSLSRSCHRRGRRRRRRAQHVVRRRYRCGHDPHRDAANSPRQVSRLGALVFGLVLARRRSRALGFRDEPHGSRAFGRHHPLLYRRVHGVAEARARRRTSSSAAPPARCRRCSAGPRQPETSARAARSCS